MRLCCAEGQRLSPQQSRTAVYNRDTIHKAAKNAVSQRNRIGHIYFQFDGQGHIAAVRNAPTGNGISYLSNVTYDLKGFITSDSFNTNSNVTNDGTHSYSLNAKRRVVNQALLPIDLPFSTIIA